jgi:AraC-like DNA-binding protein
MNDKTILIVEDEFLIAKDLEGLLLAEGYKVIAFVTSVNAAIEIIEETKPDLVITDISLNGAKDGVDLGRYLIAKDTIPFIYLTSHADKLTLERVKETRPYGFIVKPFKDPDVITTVDIVLSNFVHRNIDVLRKKEETIDEVPFVLKKVVSYIQDNITEKIIVDDLAKLTKWKSQHFQRLFSKYLGVSPSQYILNQKIEKGISLLIETDMTIAEISFELGFQSSSNFFNAFKKYTGKTPDFYRKWYRTSQQYRT